MKSNLKLSTDHKQDEVEDETQKGVEGKPGVRKFVVGQAVDKDTPQNVGIITEGEKKGCYGMAGPSKTLEVYASVFKEM